MPHGRPAKRRRLTPPIDDSAVSKTIPAKDLFNRAAEWNLEQAYEQKARRKPNQESTRLPIKTATGKIQQVPQGHTSSEDETDSVRGTDEEENLETPPTEELDHIPQAPLRQQIVAAKEELAKLASQINEDPEEHAASFRRLLEITDRAPHDTIKKLALASQAAVYIDVIPGYRIRAYSEQDLGTGISKDVRKLRQYEQALVTNYHSYIRQITGIIRRSKQDSSDPSTLRSTAISCLCKLLASVPHFNFRSELLNSLVDQLSASNITPDFEKCVSALSEYFTADDDGASSLEAVQALTKMMKTKDYHIHESVLNTLFHLRLLNELPAEVTSPGEKSEAPTYRGKKLKQKWEHRSKRERKLARDRKKVAKDMKEADAVVSHEERDRMQSETLKLVFATYFRILKLRIPSLMGAVLEGLAKFAHLINQDFFGDLLEVLKDVIGQYTKSKDNNSNDDADTGNHRDAIHTSLLATQTAFALLQNQEVSKSASSLHLDLSFFTSYIYRSLYPLSLAADLELRPKTLHLSGSYSNEPSTQHNRINVSTPSLLLIRVLEATLLPTHSPQSVSPTLIAAFVKRLLTISLQTPERTSLALLSFLTKVTHKHGRKISPLWYTEERRGDGVFDGGSDTVDGTRVWCEGSGMWEGELLRKHYCPGVMEGWSSIEGIVKGLT